MSEFTFDLTRLRALELYQLRDNLVTPSKIIDRDPLRAQRALAEVEAELARRAEEPLRLKRRASSKPIYAASAVRDDQGTFN